MVSITLASSPTKIRHRFSRTPSKIIVAAAAAVVGALSRNPLAAVAPSAEYDRQVRCLLEALMPDNVRAHLQLLRLIHRAVFAQNRRRI